MLIIEEYKKKIFIKNFNCLIDLRYIKAFSYVLIFYFQ